MTPRHVGRWAEKRSLPRTAGYAEGLKAMLRVLRRTEELGADTATVYAFSAENFARPAEETAAILDVVRRWNDDYAEEWRRFPAPLRESIERVTERTAANRGLHLVIALGYGGREDIVNAARVAAKQGKIDKEHFEEALSSHGLPPLDLIVRSGGERRLSGFMLYEAAYAELLFLDKLWPDMTAEDVDAAFGDFAARTRKFGA